MQDPHLSHPSHSNPNINIIIPNYPKSSSPTAKILKQHNFKVIFSPSNKLSLSKLKDPIKKAIVGESIVLPVSVVGLTCNKLNLNYVSVYMKIHSVFEIKKKINQPLLNTAGKTTTLLIFILPKLFANPPL